MVKILLGTACVLLLAACLLVIQIGFRKDPAGSSANALPPASSKSLGGIVVGDGLLVSKSGLTSVSKTAIQLSKVLFTKSWRNSDQTYTNEIWWMDYDGAHSTRVNITLPSGLHIGSPIGASGNSIASLSPDGKTVFFNVSDSKGLTQGIFACNIYGTAVRQLTATSGADSTLHLNSAY